MIWLHFIISLFYGVALIGIAIGKVRHVSGAAAGLFAGGGALVPVVGCCITARSQAFDSVDDPVLMMQVTTILATGVDLLGVILVAAAFAVLARARIRTET